MSESLDGLMVAATRQNAGRSANACAAPAPPPRPPGATGGTNWPAATSCGGVMVVFGSASDVASRWQAAPSVAGTCAETTAPDSNAHRTALMIFMGILLL